MAPGFGLDFVSAVVMGAAGVVASAALYVFSGSRDQSKRDPEDEQNNIKASKAPAQVANDQAQTLRANDNTKQLTKKQRQKLAKQKKREDAATNMKVAQTASSPALSGAESDGPAPSTEKPKKKKNKKKAKSKKQEVTEINDSTPTAATIQDDDSESNTEEDGELAFALALAGNQKNMQQMRSDQKLKQQKEQDREERRRQAEELQRREAAKEAEKVEADAQAADAQAAIPKQETTVIAVKTREVQIILGQGGKVIKQIRAESGARLEVSKRDDESSGNKDTKDRRLLTIVGTGDQIDAARTQLRAIFKEENAKSQVVSVGEKMAAVIGKGGSVIKRIKEETGATLDADREGGTIRVSGEPDQIEQAVVAINKITAPGDQISMKLSKRQKMLVIGKGGTMIRKIESMTQCQLDVEKTEDGGGVIKIGGDSAQVLEAMKMIQQLFHEASFTVTVACGDLIGAIIGKGGEVIRKIQDDTQVKLDIEMDKKSIVIVGYEKDVRKAQEKIESILACPVEVKPGDTKLHVDLGGYVSSVIGRGGQKVREIEAQSGAQIKVLGTDCIIVGKQAKVEAAKRLIDEILKKQVEASMRNEAAMAAVQALSESHTQRNTAIPQGEIPWGASAWGNDLAHWTASPVVAPR